MTRLLSRNQSASRCSSGTPSPALPRPRRREAGFTLVEGLIATAMLMTIAIGILPLYTRSMMNNEAGSDYTTITNAAKERAEEFFQLPFDSDPLTILAGTERVFDEYYSMNDKTWKPGTQADADAAGDPPLMTRTTTVRQFNVNDLVTPLDETAPAGAVQLKEVTVVARSTRAGGPLGPGKQNTVRVLIAQ